MKLTDENLQQATELVNAQIHELVFFAHQLNDDEVEQALDIFVQLKLNMEALEELLDESCPAIAEEDVK